MEGTTAADPNIDIMDFVKEDNARLAPVATEKPRKSSKEKQKKKKAVERNPRTCLVLQLKTPGSASTAVAKEREGRSSNMAKILMATSVHSLEEGIVLAVETMCVQNRVVDGPILSMDEVGLLTEGVKLVVETISAPTLEEAEAAPAIVPLVEGTRRMTKPMVVEINDSPSMEGNKAEQFHGQLTAAQADVKSLKRRVAGVVKTDAKEVDAKARKAHEPF